MCNFHMYVNIMLRLVFSRCLGLRRQQSNTIVHKSGRYHMDRHIELLTILCTAVELLVCLLPAASGLENVI